MPVVDTMRRRLPDQVVAQLLRAVVDGEFPPGSRLPAEAVLAERATVSRLTLREAVRVLRDKGVLRVEHGRGTFVNPPARWSALDASLMASRAALGEDPAGLAQQLTETRRVVEVGAAELAAQRRGESDLAALRETLAQMRRAHEQDDVPAFSAADVAFHDGVMAAADNPFLAALLAPVRTLVHDVRVQTSLTADLRETAIVAHQAILDALAVRDARAARRTMTDHLKETHRVIDRLSHRADAGYVVGPPPGGGAHPDDGRGD